MFDFQTLAFHQRITGRTGQAILDSTFNIGISRGASPQAEAVDAGEVSKARLVGAGSGLRTNGLDTVLAGSTDVLLGAPRILVSALDVFVLDDLQQQPCPNGDLGLADYDWTAWCNSFGVDSLAPDQSDWLRS